PNPAALEEAQRNVETAQAALSVIQEKVSAQRAQLARLEADCAEGAQRIIAWLAENPGLVNQAEEGQIPNSALCRAQAEEYQRQLSTLHAALDDYARQREQLGVLRLRHERALAALDEKRSEYRTLQTRVEALTASLAEISGHVGAVDPGPEKTAQEWKLREAEETIRALEETCRAWESERTESEARFTAQLSMIRRTLPALFQSAETCVQKALSIDALTLLDRMACMEDSSRDGIAGQPLLQLFEALQNAWPSYGTEAVADDARHDMRNAAKTWASVLEEAGFDEQRALDFLKRASASFWPRERIRQAEQDLEQANSALRDARTRVETLREGFMDFLRTNGMDESHTGATLAQTAVQLAAEKSAHETQYQILQNRIAEHKALEARIRDLIAQRVLLQKEYEAAEREFRRADRMAKLLNGELIRGRRLPFKNFILQTVFREITTRASTRLYRMSMGRYLVEPEIQGLSGNQKIGLELAIIDAWNSARRPVGTLSGGEKFMLAISLALGLADSLRERAGANRLESLFIDEGFGSLDTESLSLAISVLDTLRGDRMVAIVSHVEELATRIPSRIVVEKGSEGSRVRIERD
ncbi:MAG: hypothetical protein N3A02_03320, partial [Rectinema sp.]|nr:hypothetical protein [Rectinema sp.]